MKKQTYNCPACGEELNAKKHCRICRRDFVHTIKHNTKTGELTPEQEAAREGTDNAIAALIAEYAPQGKVTDESIHALRKAFTAVMHRHYRIPAYDIYPDKIEPAPDTCIRSRRNEEPIEITAAPGQVISIKVPLQDMVEGKDGRLADDLMATVRFINNQVEIEVPDVETYNESPGNAIPILVEQTMGELHLVAWDSEKEDPFLNVSWPRTLRTPKALTEARDRREES